jgi:two-component system chemotaxis response regulator CheB
MSEPIQAIVMGVSAGAVEALLRLLPTLPADYPLPIVITVHLPPDGESVLAELFQPKCDMQVHEVEDKELLTPGTIYFAPPNYHVLIEQNKTLSLSNEEPVLYSRPSIDILFETAADAYGEALLGILLTGANDDGARGLAVIEQAGGTVLVQDPNEAHCPIMPMAGLARCTTAKALSLSELAGTLQKVAHAQFAE